MASEKIENVLNLSLQATQKEREKSYDLDVGYDAEKNTWKLIIRHDDRLRNLYEQDPYWQRLKSMGLKIHFLSNNYAIITTRETLIQELAEQETIIYMEKPKSLYFQVTDAANDACITPLQTNQSFELRGKGVLIGIIDSGVDQNHPVFQRADGSSKILRYIVQDQVKEGQNNQEATDVSGHGTAVASIIATIASESDLIIVKLGEDKRNAYPRTTELMEALDSVVKIAQELQRPLAINLSFGNNYGSHDGQSLLETYIDSLSNIWKISIAVGSGNEGLGNNHARIHLNDQEEFLVEFEVGENLSSINLQIWKLYQDNMEIELISPSGKSSGKLRKEAMAMRYSLGETQLLVFYGTPVPYSMNQEIYLEFLPNGTYLEAGIWSVRFLPVQITVGQIDLWLPASGVIGKNSGFLIPSPETTLTIPSTSKNVITVGAYDQTRNIYANFSGRGFTRLTNQIKPDLVAPGVGITTAKAGGGYQKQSGTSFATPFVTASAALLMEWGIIRKNDSYLYGEKLKASLIYGCKPLIGETVPSPKTGWGALCLNQSLIK